LVPGRSRQVRTTWPDARAPQAAVFRCQLIRKATDAALSPAQRGAMVRAIAARTHPDPFGRPGRTGQRQSLPLPVVKSVGAGRALRVAGICGGKSTGGKPEEALRRGGGVGVVFCGHHEADRQRDQLGGCDLRVHGAFSGRVAQQGFGRLLEWPSNCCRAWSRRRRARPPPCPPGRGRACAGPRPVRGTRLPASPGVWGSACAPWRSRPRQRARPARNGDPAVC